MATVPHQLNQTSMHEEQDQDADVHEYNICPSSQERFLSNEYNKTQFISPISRLLLNDGQNVNNCVGGADPKIVQAALNASRKATKPVMIVAGNTDIALMLLYHCKDLVSDIIFYPPQQKGSL